MRAVLACGVALVLAGAVLVAQGGSATFRASDGATLTFEQIGTGEPLILLAGGPGLTPASVKPVCDQLARTHRCVLLHQRGTGLSATAAGRPGALTLRRFVADIDALRVALALERVTLVGHSWGGMLAMAYAAAHPDRTKALVLIASGGPTLDYMSWYDRNARARMNEQDAAIATYWEGQRASGADPVRVAAGLLAAGMPSTFHDRTKVGVLAESLGASRVQQRRIRSDDARPARDRIRSPWAARVILPSRVDRAGTAGSYRHCGDAAADVSIGQTDRRTGRDAGHFLWLEQPLPLFRAVATFLANLR